MSCNYHITETFLSLSSSFTHSYSFQLDTTGSVQIYTSGSFQGNWQPVITNFLQGNGTVDSGLLAIELAQIESDVLATSGSSPVNNVMSNP